MCFDLCTVQMSNLYFSSSCCLTKVFLGWSPHSPWGLLCPVPSRMAVRFPIMGLYFVDSNSSQFDFRMLTARLFVLEAGWCSKGAPWTLVYVDKWKPFSPCSLPTSLPSFHQGLMCPRLAWNSRCRWECSWAVDPLASISWLLGFQADTMSLGLWVAGDQIRTLCLLSWHSTHP